MMNNKKIFYILLSMALTTSIEIHAEVVYVTDEVKIGLHKEPSNESPIMKLVPSGTELNIIERENDLIHVEEPEGVRGWINSQNILKTKPGKTKIIELETVKKELEKKIETLEVGPNESVSHQELEQKLNAERLRVGELQVELTNIKSKTADIDSNQKLLADIKHLKNSNEQLIEQLESSGVDIENSGNQFSSDNKSTVSFIYFLIIFIFGVFGGVLVIDYLNRRRHGGFRV